MGQFQIRASLNAFDLVKMHLSETMTIFETVTLFVQCCLLVVSINVWRKLHSMAKVQASIPVRAATDLPLTILSARCHQETRRFWQGTLSDPTYCHALFSRALAYPHEPQSKEAWQYIHQNYHSQVVIWVKGHPHFPTTGIEPETLADLALERMWVSFARSPEKYGRFPQTDPAQCIRSLLRFLQTCVHSVIMKALTKPSIPLPDIIPYHDTSTFASEQFWRCIYQRLQNEKEQLLMDAIFIYGLKPRQILTQYAHIFTHIKEIYRLKENILARFKRDASLSHCLETVGGFKWD